jgi:hypothetical protein
MYPTMVRAGRGRQIEVVRLVNVGGALSYPSWAAPTAADPERRNVDYQILSLMRHHGLRQMQQLPRHSRSFVDFQPRVYLFHVGARGIETQP